MKKLNVIVTTLFALGLMTSASQAVSTMTEQQKAFAPWNQIQLAASTSCKQKCQMKRRSCGKNYLVRSTSAGLVVSPQGHRICGEQYRQCLQYC